MKIPFIDLNRQYNKIKKEVHQVINKVFETNRFILGEYVEKFEQNFASFCGAKYCIAVGNGTDALTIALRCLGLQNGDEVLIPANTFIATLEAVTLAGARPVFVDVEPESFHINLKKAEQKINSRTKAILPVHLYGNPVDLKMIREFCDYYKLYLIQDCAQAHGATFQNKNLVDFGDICCYSFYPGKNLGAYGDAGAIVTNDEILANHCRMYRNHGRIDKFNHIFEGTNSRMDALQAAVLNIKLKYLHQWNKDRNTKAYIYTNLLKSITYIRTPHCFTNRQHVFHLYVIRVDYQIRNDLIKFLNKNGITTGIHYPVALPFLKAYSYQHNKKNDFPVAYQLQNEVLSLPIFPEITQEEIEYVVENITEFYKR